MSRNINKKELKYILFAALFAIGYFFFLLPYLVEIVDEENVISNFLIFNFGILIVLGIYVKSRTLSRRIDLRTSLEYLFVVVAMDSYIPAYHVDIMTGELIKGATLSLGTTDYFFGYIGINFLNLSGILVSVWTYVVVPVALLFLAAKISRANFVRHA